MAQVSVTVNGRSYEISCDDGQEAHLFRLAEEIDRRVASLVASVGQVGDVRLLLLASLVLGDEIEDLKNELAALKGGPLARPVSGGEAAADGGALREELLGLAERIESLAQRLAAESSIAETFGPA
jgi:cell division protein ZapA